MFSIKSKKQRLKSVIVILFILLATKPNVLAFENDSIHPLLSFKHYGEDEGLTGKTVYSILQDKEGFMWFGTNVGVFRFDGKVFRRFTRQDGITDNEVFKLFQDREGRIWFLTFNGYLSFWKDGEIYNPSNTPFLKKAYLGSIIVTSFEDQTGHIWFGTQQAGFIVIKNNSVQVFQFPEANIMLRSVILVEDSSGGVWSFKNNKMYKLLEENFKDSIALMSKADPLRACQGKNNSELYYLAREGIFKISNLSSSLFIKEKSLPPSNKTVNLVSDGTYLWVCTLGNGCYEYLNGKLNKKYFEGGVVNFVRKDREGNLWFSTFTEGVFMIPSGNDGIFNFNKSSGLSGDKITSLALDKDSSVWLGYSNGIIDAISNHKKRTYRFTKPDEPTFSRVISIIADSSIIWCGTDMGVYYIQNHNLNFIPFDKKVGTNPHYSVKQLMKANNNAIYATYSFNLLKIMEDSKGFYIHEEFDSLVRTFSIVEDKKDHYVVSSMRGLIQYEPNGKYSALKTDINFSDIRIIDMKTDSDNLLLLATSGNGLYIMKDGKMVQHFSTANDISDDNCFRIFLTGHSCYLATANGLNILEKQNGRYKLVRVLTMANGLLSNSVNDVIAKDEKIYMATDKGFTVFSSTLSAPVQYSSRVIITSVITDTVHPLSANTYIFSSKIPRLLIRFAYPVFNPASQAKVLYRLIQNDNDNLKWITSGNNEIEFSSLSPGSYIIELKPGLKNIKDNQLTKLYFEIRPLWYQTVMSKSIAGIMFLGVLIFTVRRRVSRRYERQINQQMMLENERHRIASDMHDDIGSDLTQINIWSNILKAGGNKNTEVAEKISRSSNEVLEKMDQIIWALNSVHDHSEDLIMYIHEYASQYLENTNMKLIFQQDESMPDFKISAIQRRNIFLVLKELLHNTVKHSEAKNVTLKIFNSSSTLKIHYADDGSGYDQNEITEGMGFSTMRERMKEINSSFVAYSKKGEGVSVQLEIGIDAIRQHNFNSSL
ncbi:MAG TPA: two-component regulator propeller domain-containing protein [Bacteroidia bacterium]|nr:two-component regulator propeller domain-containing protein [Bacteroidia bacterium]